MASALFFILADALSPAPGRDLLFAIGLVFLAGLPGAGCGIVVQSIRGAQPLPVAVAVFAAMVGGYLWPGWSGEKHPAWGWGIAAAVLFGVGFHMGVRWRLRRARPDDGMDPR